MLRQLATQAVSRSLRGRVTALTALAGSLGQSCCFGAGAKGFRRAPKQPPASEKAASEVVLKQTLEDGLANSSGEQPEPTWVPVRHKGGKVYYWNKKTGASELPGLQVCFAEVAAFAGMHAAVCCADHGSLQE